MDLLVFSRLTSHWKIGEKSLKCREWWENEEKKEEKQSNLRDEATSPEKSTWNHHGDLELIKRTACGLEG